MTSHSLRQQAELPSNSPIAIYHLGSQPLMPLDRFNSATNALSQISSLPVHSATSFCPPLPSKIAWHPTYQNHSKASSPDHSWRNLTDRRRFIGQKPCPFADLPLEQYRHSNSEASTPCFAEIRNNAIRNWYSNTHPSRPLGAFRATEILYDVCG